jgi:ubiquinone/menaquinone biosynthesis C-methylase UbiE
MAGGERDGLGKQARGALEERIALMAPSRRLRIALAEEALADFAAGGPIRVLDAGCGDGLPLLSIAKRHPEWTLVGMDLSEELLASARERARNRGLANASFRQADLTKPALPEDGFDAVIALECLNEIPDDRAALRTMAASLAPGGIAVVQAPEASWTPILKGSDPTWRAEVRHGYSAEELVAVLAAAGLGEIEVRPTFRATVELAQELRDRIKDRGPVLRATAFPAMLAAVRAERWGLTGGRANALFSLSRRPASG